MLDIGGLESIRGGGELDLQRSRDRPVGEDLVQLGEGELSLFEQWRNVRIVPLVVADDDAPFLQLHRLAPKSGIGRSVPPAFRRAPIEAHTKNRWVTFTDDGPRLVAVQIETLDLRRARRGAQGVAHIGRLVPGKVSGGAQPREARVGTGRPVSAARRGAKGLERQPIGGGAVLVGKITDAVTRGKGPSLGVDHGLDRAPGLLAGDLVPEAKPTVGDGGERDQPDQQPAPQSKRPAGQTALCHTGNGLGLTLLIHVPPELEWHRQYY